jgi:hypothetical protein
MAGMMALPPGAMAHAAQRPNVAASPNAVRFTITGEVQLTDSDTLAGVIARLGDIKTRVTESVPGAEIAMHLPTSADGTVRL